MEKKQQDKHNIFVYKLINIRNVIQSERNEFKNKHQYGLELNIDKTDYTLFLICNDVCQLNEWQENID
jgi:hypothetical protein